MYTVHDILGRRLGSYDTPHATLDIVLKQLPLSVLKTAKVLRELATLAIGRYTYIEYGGAYVYVLKE